MMTVVTGGSGSGKSEYAEGRALEFSCRDLVYIATMVAFDEEAFLKIERHRQMRENKHFKTVECYTSLKDLVLKKENTVLLDCMSNLVANEMYQENGAKENTVEEILLGISKLKRQVKNLVIVTNEVFSDGLQYDQETTRYLSYLGRINQGLANMADELIEVVYGIPVYRKGENRI